jgi:hypothetical protein
LKDDGTRKVGVGSDFAFEWEVMGNKYYEKTFNITASTVPAIYDCSVNIYSLQGSLLYSQSFTLAVKYVRREVRSMSVEDRRAFFEALFQLYSVTSAEGKELYGDEFESAEYLAYLHLEGAGRNDCDHWHDGAGFVVQHLAFTLQAEQALQAINPAIAMPYWEYSMVR